MKFATFTRLLKSISTYTQNAEVRFRFDQDGNVRFLEFPLENADGTYIADLVKALKRYGVETEFQDCSKARARY